MALLGGCSSRGEKLDQFAKGRAWEQARFFTKSFVLTGMMRLGREGAEKLAVYIEGDGLAWITASEISSDPTPTEPTAMELAFRHPPGSVLYLARPCQYVSADTNGDCHSRYWTSHRFAPEVIASLNAAIDQAKRRMHARRITLIGYSGGGTVAALLAASRSDVDMLVTVVGNLDHQMWTSSEGLTPLFGSLSPVDQIGTLKNIKQVHFVGAKDKIVPPKSVFSYRDRFPRDRLPEIRVLQQYDHNCCWIDAWPSLMKGRWPKENIKG
jgi:dienelactone hydrolase